MNRRIIGAVAVGLALAWACGNDHIRRAAEQLEVVPGTPTVGQGLPGVERGDGGADASVYGPAAPFQVDSFTQQEVSKVDILWVIDNSRSMQAKQQRVQQNIQGFMQFLQAQKVDYHLGVVSTDTFDPAQSGRLQNKASLPQPWINADAGAQAEAYFFTNIGLGELGTGDEKGLLAGMMALTAPLSPTDGSANPDAGARNCARLADGTVDCFLRKDAALYTVMVSDEEDSSCSPLTSNAEGCTDSDIRTSNGFGTTDYWTRFYSGVKGLGAVSKVAAITGTEATAHDCGGEFQGFCAPYTGVCTASNNCTVFSNNNTCCQAIFNTCANALFAKAQWCHLNSTNAAPWYQVAGGWLGCVSRNSADGGVDFTAYSGGRYKAVAQGTGGIATSICDQDYTPALKQLGLQASGLRSDFPLSRAPISTSIRVLVNGTEVIPGAGTWQYVGCENHVAVNVIRFTDAARPASGAKVAASYDVNTRGLGTCP